MPMATSSRVADFLARRDLRDVNESLDPGSDLYEGAEVLQRNDLPGHDFPLADNLVNVRPRVGEEGLYRKRDALFGGPEILYSQDLDVHLFARLEDGLGIVYACVAYFRNVKESFQTADIDERTEPLYSGHTAPLQTGAQYIREGAGPRPPERRHIPEQSGRTLSGYRPNLGSPRT